MAELIEEADDKLVLHKINRGIDLLSPVWNILDLAPEGRGDWNAKHNYE